MAATSLHRAEEFTGTGHVRVPHGVNAPMPPMQPPTPGARGDRVVAQPAPCQLGDREHAVLARGDPRNQTVGSSHVFLGLRPGKT